MVKVSIILPSLNVEKYIDECINSAITQTLQEIEIICVDAGSTDGTLGIIEEYVKKDNRVKLLNSDRKSYGYQMNLGMDSASGEYIGILETDDYILPTMMEKLYAIAKEKNLDFIKSDFYRFTGQGENLSKARYSFNTNGYLYHETIDISKYQDAFNFVMNTWCGIYKRDFLMRNNIRHNETPGASFQDNGFWFQTFMYAKRAYFFDEPFYMNRRDNEGSSVYSKGKVYCICDEYEFILQKIKEKNLLDNFGFTFAKACFVNYKGNLNRIADEYKEDFLVRWAEDFKKFRKMGILNIDLFNETDWEMLLDIMENPREYYEQKLLKEKHFYDEASQHHNIIIYGAGMVGRRILEKLTYCEKPANVICFAVSKIENNLDAYKGVPIKEIKSLLDYRENGLVVIGTTAIYQDEIRNTLEEYGFKNMVAAPDNIEKNEKYFKKLTMEERKTELKKWYFRNTGVCLNIDNPVTYNEKIQALKLSNELEEDFYLMDLFEARKWASEIIGYQYMPETIGVYDSIEDVDYDELPDAFYIKCTHAKTWRTFIENKQMANWKEICRKFNKFLNSNYAYRNSQELFYERLEPRVIVEKAICKDGRLDSYMFVCFDGKIQFIIEDVNNAGLYMRRRNVYDSSWKRLNIKIKYPNSKEHRVPPKHFEIMLKMAEELSKGHKALIIHFWDTEEKPIFNKVRFILESGIERIY